MTTELKEAIEILSPAVEKITNTAGQGFDFTYQVLLKQAYVSSLQDVSTLVILFSNCIFFNSKFHSPRHLSISNIS